MRNTFTQDQLDDTESLLQPNCWSCLVTAFAMALETSVKVLIEEIGHDGSEVIFPTLSDPQRRRAFHIQEFILPCLKRGYALVCIEAHPILGAEGNNFYDLPETNLLSFLDTYTGVLVGEINNQMHAVYWDKELCRDPNGTSYPLEAFSIREFNALIVAEANLPS